MEIGVLLLFFGLVAAIVALFGFVIWWAMHVQKRRSAAWLRVSTSLGLQFTGREVFGTLDGQWVKLRLVSRGSGKNRQTWTVVSGSVTPALDLGLAVTRQGFLQGAFGALFGSRDIPVGDAAFDAAFVVRADEPARVVALLSPDLRRVLLKLHSDGASFALYDAGIQIESRGAIEDEKWLTWALRTVALVAGLAQRARASVPVAAPLAEHRDAWAAFAKASALRGMDTPLCMWGRMEGAKVSAYAVRSGELQYRLEVLVLYDVPLGIGLLVRPKSMLDGLALLFGGQDVVLGDPGFDPTFVVKAARVDRLGEIVDVEVRRRALELTERVGAVQLRDDGVVLRSGTFPSDPAEVPRLVAHAKALARLVRENANRASPAAVGPYR